MYGATKTVFMKRLLQFFCTIISDVPVSVAYFNFHLVKLSNMFNENALCVNTPYLQNSKLLIKSYDSNVFVR